MNTYNQNLQSTILQSLNDLETEKQSLGSKLDTAMYSLYYAEAARITAAEQLNESHVNYDFIKSVLNEAVINNNISVNTLATANEQKTYMGLSVSNAAVCAANVQIAANAIVKVASDVGGILSIINAADYGTEMYLLAEDTYKLSNETAYAAEVASQTALEMSTQTAEVASGTVMDMAKTTNDSMNNLYQVISTNFQNISATVDNNNKTLDTVSALEKQAEGVLEYTNVEYYAAASAYSLSNQELNLNLTVPAKNRSNTKYTVVFNPYKSPFQTSNPKLNQPVKYYYIMLVKADKSSTFSLGNAEGVIQEKGRYVQIDASLPKYKTEISEKISINDLNDSDGEPFKLGCNYVIYVMAYFNDEYKKFINNFDDYLTAPSEDFKLCHSLAAPKTNDIKIEESNKKQSLLFKLEEEKSYEVQYRCMFLPVEESLTRGLLTQTSLNSLEEEIEKMEKIAEKYSASISSTSAEIRTVQNSIEANIELLSSLNKDVQAATSEKTRKKTNDDIELTTGKIKQQKVNLAQLQIQLKKLKDEEQNELRFAKLLRPVSVGFFFNQKIAEQISSANYTVPKKIEKIAHKHDEKCEVKASVALAPEITDVFGNRLGIGKKYIPLVLSVPNEVDDENNKMFTANISDYNSTTPFVYSY